MWFIILPHSKRSLETSEFFSRQLDTCGTMRVSGFQKFGHHLCSGFTSTGTNIENTFLEVGRVLVSQMLAANGSSLCLCLAITEL
eukprot:Skav226655  [mRNA]  locus=scaffold2733:44876:45130:- [translate_table: standard]